MRDDTGGDVRNNRVPTHQSGIQQCVPREPAEPWIGGAPGELLNWLGAGDDPSHGTYSTG
ncbi:hypothetical protein [Candidatus Nitrospira salsa]